MSYIEKNLFSFAKELFSPLLLLFFMLNYIFAGLPNCLGKEDYNIGVYYFPGWINGTNEWWDPPWGKIKPYPERTPLLGYYPEGDVSVMEQQVEWMNQYGIDFIAFDWYWKGNKTHLEHALKAYLKSSNRNKVKFCLLWANHFKEPQSVVQFKDIVAYWAKNYFIFPQYLMVDSKPVIIIFSDKHLEKNAKQFNHTAADLLKIAREISKTSGLNGIYFVAGSAKPAYNALTNYNYHSTPETHGGKISTSYLELCDAYKENWDWRLKTFNKTYFLPLTAGWDKKPWGSNTAHDNCSSTPEQFKKHLQDAKNRMNSYPDKTKKTAIIFAWNEYGEGGYVEPTLKWGFKYLEAIKDVFGFSKR